MVNLLTDTLLSAFTTLIPTWSKAFTEKYGLSSEYYVVANMLLVDVIKRVCSHISESVVIGILTISALVFLSRQFVSWNEIRFKLSRIGKKRISNMSTHDATIVNSVSKVIEDNPSWIINKGNTMQYLVEVSLATSGKCRYFPHGYMCLKPPKYNIELECMISANDKGKLCGISINLYEGVQEDLQIFISDAIKSYNSSGQDLIRSGIDYAIGDYVCISYLDHIDNFFHSDKRHLMKTLEWANSNPTTTALGMLLYGPPGTGKTSFAQRIAKHLKRIPYVINLKNITKRKELMRLLLNPSMTTEGLVTKDVLFIIDEFDKGLKNLNAMSAMYEKRQMAFNHMIEQTETSMEKLSTNMRMFNGNDEPKQVNLNDLMTIDDLLSIISGPIHIPGLIVMAMTNDFEYIQKQCPALVRPGRFTPVLFDNGDRELLQAIIKHYVHVNINVTAIPTSFRFQQSRIIELVNVMKTYMNGEEIGTEFETNYTKYNIAAVTAITTAAPVSRSTSITQSTQPATDQSVHLLFQAQNKIQDSIDRAKHGSRGRDRRRSSSSSSHRTRGSKKPQENNE